jgi:tRNA threonylcarbamoyladenosine biosynthesis protein TsaE
MAQAAMDEYRFLAQTEQDTQRLGEALAAILPASATVALIGTLGAGKTRLAQAIARGCGIADDVVVSPTFVLCQPYYGLRTIYHMDAYRLKDDDEFLQLGPEEYFESDALTLVEWADRVIDCLPPDRLEVHIRVAGETSREFRLVAAGRAMSRVVTALAARLDTDFTCGNPH